MKAAPSFGLSLGLIALALSLSACSPNANPLLSNAGYTIKPTPPQVRSWKALNEQHVIMQQYDYSCGAASLATLMTYYFNDLISEQELVDYIKTTFTPAEYAVIEKEGLSLLELEKISRSKGYQTASVRLKLAALKQLKGPVIVFLKTQDYRHFVVLRGIVEDRVFLADPSRGNIRLAVDEFVKEWQGETFVLGKEGFGTPFEHNLAIMHQAGFRNEQDVLRAARLVPPHPPIKNYDDKQP